MPQTILVVHGLWMTGAIFAIQRRQLVRRGYRVETFSYPSVRLPLQEIAARLTRTIETLACPGVHFVGHSLGGLVVLETLARATSMSVGRVVLLGSPANGSRSAAQLVQSRFGRKLVGKALLEWEPSRAAAVTSSIDVGMIAGTSRFGLGSLIVKLPPPNDGVVCIDETRLPGLRDHVTMPVAHSEMIVSARVADQICHFLEHGHFARD